MSSRKPDTQPPTTASTTQEPVQTTTPWRQRLQQQVTTPAAVLGLFSAFILTAVSVQPSPAELASFDTSTVDDRPAAIADSSAQQPADTVPREIIVASVPDGPEPTELPVPPERPDSDDFAPPPNRTLSYPQMKRYATAALAAQRYRNAFRMAERAYQETPSQDVLVIKGKAACGLKNKSAAKAVVKELPVASKVRRDVRSACRGHGIRLGA
ncbi:MAG: hypothetical protein AAF721_00140 [Myxococcota bacterium]